MMPAVIRLRHASVIVALIALPALAVACGSKGVQVNDRGAQLFADRCAGCHTLSAAGTHGSVGERISGPNLDFRKETKNTVLYAIRNGGFSGAIMPQNVVVGQDAQAVANFLAQYSGRDKQSGSSASVRGLSASARRNRANVAEAR